jgi:Predicted endonuclease distantly related to archaeal Holliday junction resolvase
MNTVEKGERGENTALNYLYTKGLKLIARNWRYRHYEIDLIMEDDLFVRIIEIRSLTFPNIIEPQMTIKGQKQKGLIIAANKFVKINQIKKRLFSMLYL